MSAVAIKPRKASSRYVAIDLQSRSKIIAEGTTARATVNKAEKTGKAYSMMFLPKKNATYIL